MLGQDKCEQWQWSMDELKYHTCTPVGPHEALVTESMYITAHVPDDASGSTFQAYSCTFSGAYADFVGSILDV